MVFPEENRILIKGLHEARGGMVLKVYDGIS